MFMIKEMPDGGIEEIESSEVFEWVYDYFSHKYDGEIEFNDYGNRYCEDYVDFMYVFLANDPITKAEEFVKEVNSLGMAINKEDIEKIAEVKVW